MVEHFFLTYRWDTIVFYHSCQSRPERNSHEDVIFIPQSYRTRASPSDDVVSYSWDRWQGLTSPQSCSQCLLQSQSTGLGHYKVIMNAQYTQENNYWEKILFSRNKYIKSFYSVAWVIINAQVTALFNVRVKY